jgi:hypothetical protein
MNETLSFQFDVAAACAGCKMKFLWLDDRNPRGLDDVAVFLSSADAFERT